MRGLLAFWKKRATKQTLGHPSGYPFNADSALHKLFRIGGDTAAKVDITHDTAMQIETVFACVRVISETIASLPVILYERVSDREKRRATEHPLYKLLHDQPNEAMTSFEFREVAQSHLELRGNFYAEIVRDAANRVVALYPLPADKIRAESKGWQIVYKVQTANGNETVSADRILHLKFLPGTDGLVGLDPIAACRESLGISWAAREFGATFFGNGSTFGGFLEHPGEMSQEAQMRLIETLENRHKGVNKAHRLGVLEEGMKYKQIGVAPENAQFLETRRFQVTDIARIFRVPPHMIGDLDRATFSNVEQQAIDFVVHSIRPRLVRWEQALNRALLSDADRKRYYFEFLVDGLLRGDILARYQAYQIGINTGFLSRNEVRNIENLNPADGLDEYLVQPGVMPASQLGRQPTFPTEPAPKGTREMVDEIILAVNKNGKAHEASN